MPSISCRPVPFADLEAALPVGTRRIDADERAEILRRRLLAVQRRYRA